MRHAAALALLAATLGTFGHPRYARAQAAPDAESADALFDEGMRLGARGQYAEACPKLAASVRLDPGVGAMLYLAECYVRVGRTASAWGAFRDAAEFAASHHDGREKLARDRAAQLEPRLPRLTVVVPEGPRQGTTVRRDGEALEPSVWSAPVLVDPGVHVVDAVRPGSAPFHAVVISREGELATVTVTGLAPPPATMPPPAHDAPAPAEPAQPIASPSSHAEEPSPGRSQRIVGIAAGAAGVAGVAMGAIFGVKASSDFSEQKNECGAPGCSPAGHAAAMTAHANAVNDGAISTVAFVAAGALLAGGATLFFTAPKGDHPASSATLAVQPAAGPGGGGVFLSGRF